MALREIWREFESRYSTLDVNGRRHPLARACHLVRIADQYVRLPANLTGAGDATQVTVVRASGSLFDVLGVGAAIGRTLKPAHEPDAAPDDRHNHGHYLAAALWW